MFSKKGIFFYIFIFAIVLVSITILILNNYYADKTERYLKNFLKKQWDMVAQQLNANHETRSVYTGLNYTVISEEGVITTDTLNGGESYMQEDEVQTAFKGTASMSVKYNYALKIYMVYYAEKLNYGNVLRISYPAGDYYKSSKESFSLILFVFMLSGISGMYAYFISRKGSLAVQKLDSAVDIAKDGGIMLPSFNNTGIDSALSSLSAAIRQLKAINEERLIIAEQLNYILDNIAEGVVLIQQENIIYSNKRAEDILNYRLPRKITDIDDVGVLKLFSALVDNNQLELHGRYINISIYENNIKLLILQDISTETAYMNFKTDLVANISHELKTPLSMIIVAAETIIKDNHIKKEFLNKFLNTIQKNAKRMNILFDDLIYLARLEHTDGKDVEFCANVNDITAELMEVPDYKGRVFCKVTAGKVRIHGTHLFSVLTNLISNAVKYSNGDVLVYISCRDNMLRIEVADEGPVISKSDSKRIFERFYTQSKSRNRESGGTGLGLAIVKHITRIYKGNVALVENENGGNSFIVELLEKY